MNTRRLHQVLVWAAILAAAGLAGRAQEGAQPLYDPVLYEGLDYRMIGPHRGGRVTAVAGVRQQPDTFYMGPAGGGVWKTVDAGLIWKNVSDGYFEVGSIGSIDVADSDPNVIYAGTGSAGIRSNVSTGRGVYKSTDAGRTWSFAGLPEAGQIGAVRVHPANPGLVYVAALGHPFGANPERGVYRSKDGAKTWELVLFVSDKVGAVDLAVNPSNPREIYAAMWRGERKPWTIISGSEKGGIYKTGDGGDSWKKLANGLPEGVVGKGAVSVSPADPERVYVLLEAPDGKGGVYRSDDGGESFEFVNDQKSLLYRPFYYTQIDADPQDADTVYVNNEGFFKSSDGGRHFRRLSTPHGDNHDIWINPDDPDIYIQSNDGGANVTRDGGRTWTTQLNQPTAELYQVEVDSRFPYRVYGAQQDNTTISVPSKVSRAPIDPKQDWYAVSGCETGPVRPHPEDPDIVYGGCKGRHSRYNHRTGEVQQYWVYPHFNYGHRTQDMPFRFQRTAPMILSPHDPNVIYHGSHVIHKSSDEGRTWEVISPDLTAYEPDKQGYSGGPITRDITGEEIYSAIYAIAESPHERGVIWVGANDGPVHITRDGGENWKKVTPEELPPGARINRIELSPHAPGRAYLAAYRFQLDDWAPYIFRSDDYGESWTRLTDGANGIPADHPTRAVREDPDRQGLLYAGTEFGMFVSFNDGGNWQSLQLDLPAVPITGIKVHEKDLVISTMGRSFWILDDVSVLHQIDDGASAGGAFLYRPRDTYRARWVGDLKRRFPGYAPEYPPTGAMIHYYLPEDAPQPVELEILDGEGKTVREFSSQAGEDGEGEPSQGMRFGRSSGSGKLSASAGMHRFVWDLEYPAAKDARSGPMAVPGDYQVRLKIGGWSQTQPFRLLIDPRMSADQVSQEDLEAQFQLATRLRDAMNAARQAISRIQGVRSQLESVADNIRKAGLDEQFALDAESLAGELTQVEELLVQTEEGKVGAQLEPQLISQMTYLWGMITSADQRPPRSAYERFKDIESVLETHQGRLAQLLREDIAAFNDRLREEGVPPVIYASE